MGITDWSTDWFEHLTLAKSIPPSPWIFFRRRLTDSYFYQISKDTCSIPLSFYSAKSRGSVELAQRSWSRNHITDFVFVISQLAGWSYIINCTTVYESLPENIRCSELRWVSRRFFSNFLGIRIHVDNRNWVFGVQHYILQEFDGDYRVRPRRMLHSICSQ